MEDGTTSSDVVYMEVVGHLDFFSKNEGSFEEALELIKARITHWTVIKNKFLGYLALDGDQKGIFRESEKEEFDLD